MTASPPDTRPSPRRRPPHGRVWRCVLLALLALLLPYASAAAPPRADGSARAFVEMEVDDRQPYVQQSVGVVVRLYYAAQLASGQLVLDAPAQASLQVIGQDRTDVREVGGRRYNVVERRYLLVPERSGPLSLPGARFDGRTAGGFFEDMFGGGDGRLRASSTPQQLQVQAQPADAPQPWLPLHALRLRYTQAPARARSGEAVTVEVEAVAQGATRAQFTDLPVPEMGAAAQVFAEPAQYEETFAGGSPQLKVTRRYAVVPRVPGALRVPGVELRWWDVGSGQPRVARVPDLSLDVAAGTGASAPPPPPGATAGGEADGAGDSLALPATQPASSVLWPWQAAVATLLLLWLATLYWGWRRGRRTRMAQATLPIAPVAVTASDRRALQQQFMRLLDHGDLGEAMTALCHLAGVTRLEEVIARLHDPQQRQALQQLQQARWGGAGDLPAVRHALRRAFHDGPHWSPPVASTDTGLPPLYPPR